MDKTIETMIDIAGRWESLDPLKDLNDTNRFIRQGQKDIQFLLDMIEAKDAEIDGLTEDVIGLKQDLREIAEGNGTSKIYQRHLEIVGQLEQQLAAMTQARDEQCAGKMAFYNGMNDMREQRTKLERQLSKVNEVQP